VRKEIIPSCSLLRYGPNLDQLRVGQTAGILVDSKCQLRLYVNGVDQGVAAKGITANTFYAVADVYGQCEEIRDIRDNL
jgi:neuralized-like protein 4